MLSATPTTSPTSVYEFREGRWREGGKEGEGRRGKEREGEGGREGGRKRGREGVVSLNQATHPLPNLSVCRIRTHTCTCIHVRLNHKNNIIKKADFEKYSRKVSQETGYGVTTPPNTSSSFFKFLSCD